MLFSLLTLASCAAALPFLPLRPVPVSASPLYQDPLFFPSLFAGARYVGYFLNPAFQSTIGQENVQRLDNIIDHFCLPASDSKHHSKTCQTILAKLDRLAAQTTPRKQSQRYRELLTFACMTSDSTSPLESCQPLLADADCFVHSTADMSVKTWRLQR